MRAGRGATMTRCDVGTLLHSTWRQLDAGTLVGRRGNWLTTDRSNGSLLKTDKIFAGNVTTGFDRRQQPGPRRYQKQQAVWTSAHHFPKHINRMQPPVAQIAGRPTSVAGGDKPHPTQISGTLSCG